MEARASRRTAQTEPVKKQLKAKALRRGALQRRRGGAEELNGSLHFLAEKR